MRTKHDILSEIKKCDFPHKEVAISLDEFFDSTNCSDDCIGVNLYPEQPSHEVFYQTFKGLIASGKADKIFIRISDIDEPEDWFFTDTVYIIGNLTIDELKDAIKSLSPDEIYEDWSNGKPVNVETIGSGMKVYSVWWD